MWELKIGGMRCQGCVDSVRRAVESQAPARLEDVDLASGRARVAAQHLDGDQLGRDLAQAGLELVTIRPDASGGPAEPGSAPREGGHPPASPHRPGEPGGAAGELVELDLSGMTCVQCAAGIERALRALPEVQDVRVSFAAQAALVRVSGGRGERGRLLDTVRAAGYGARWAGAEQDRQSLAREWRWFALATGLAALALAVLLLPPLRRTPGLRLALAFLTLVGPGAPFLRQAWRSLRSRRPGMDLLVALGAIMAFAGSASVALGWLPAAADHGLAAVWLVFFLRGGRLLEARARRRVSSTLRGLVEALPARAVRVQGGRPAEVAAEALAAGDLVQVGPAERFPADGIVREGSSAADESALTGESLPVDKAPGASVSAGTVNLHGELRVEVTRAGRASALGQLAHVLRASLMEPAPVSTLTDRIAAVFVPLVILLGAVAFLLATARVGWAGAWVPGLSTLLIACPCALSLATPVALLAGTQRALSQGVLCKSLAGLEAVAGVDVVMLDKTGTLTQARPRVVRPHVCDGGAEELPLLRRLASASRHPLAQAVAQHLAGGPPDAALAEGGAAGLAIEEEAGAGIRGRRADGKELRLGSPAFTGVEAPEGAGGSTLVTASLAGRALAWWEVEDPLRPDAAAAVAGLQARGLAVVLVSGDRPSAVRRVAGTLGIEEWHAGCSPTDKVELLTRRQAEGQRVLFAGDGFNDGAALARADVGVAWGGGTDLARDAGQLVLLRGEPGQLLQAWDTARATRRIVRQNLAFASAYNLLAVPWAMGLFASSGVPVLPPWVAALAMSASSLSVVLNALRLAPARVDSAPAVPSP